MLSIVKNHNGIIDVHSEVGKGTEFKIFFPANEEQTEIHAPQDHVVHVGHGETILVVDDELSLQNLLRIALEDRNFKVLSAFDAIEALKIYAEYYQNIDVVLLDMLMPKLNGPSTIPELRKINPNVKIIGMSGSMFENLSNEMKLLMQELPFLQKPFYSEEVVTLVNDVLYGVQKACVVA